MIQVPRADERDVYDEVEIPDPTWQPTAPTTPGVVLDPFGGTGTTALVASVLGRDAITVDLSRDYLRLADWRTGDERQREAVAARATTCPRCGSGPGVKCVNGKGNSAALHKERKAAGAVLRGITDEPTKEAP